MSTEHEEMQRKLIFGYIHIHIEPQIDDVIPIDIYELCFIYYYLQKFIWNQERHKHWNIVFTENDQEGITEIRSNDYGNWRICIGQNVISSTLLQFKYYEWTIKLLQVYNGSLFRFFIGFINTPKEQSIYVNNWNIHLADTITSESASYIDDQYAIFIHSAHQCFKRFGKGIEYGQDLLDGKDPKEFKEGDIFKLKFDFVKMEVLLYYNDEFINVAFSNIEPVIIPAICIDGSVKIACIEQKFY